MSPFPRLTSGPLSVRSESISPPSAGSVLSSIGITKRKLKKLDAIRQAHDLQRRRHRAFTARPVVLCRLPVRRLKKHFLEYSRQNGEFRLRVIGHPDYGLPFGQDRMLLIGIASMSTHLKTRVIRFRSAATILETFGLPKDGRCYKPLIAGFERIFYSTVFFTSDVQNAETIIITCTSFRFVSTLKLLVHLGNPSNPGRGPESAWEYHRAVRRILE